MDGLESYLIALVTLAGPVVAGLIVGWLLARGSRSSGRY